MIIHVFADASEDAYGCCVYAATTLESQLIYAKAKVAPLQAPTLPRLELQASMAMQRLEHVPQNLQVTVQQVIAWSDRLTTLQWIAVDSNRWKTWVRNRVVNIQDISAKHSVTWRHCPGSENPVDLAPRGTTVRALETERWENSPDWLLDQEQWPWNLVSECTTECEEEARVIAVHAAVTSVALSSSQVWYKRLSRWSRLLGVARRLLAWRRNKEQLEERATRILFRIVQRECFVEELQALQGNHPISRSSRLYAFQPYKDKCGLIRVGGRLCNSQLPMAAKHLVLLADYPVTQALLRSLHVRSLPQGVDAVLTKVHALCFIIGDRRLLRSTTLITCYLSSVSGQGCG